MDMDGGADEPRSGIRTFEPGNMPPLFGDTAATLIVEDEPAVARLIDVILSGDGYRCTHASSGTEARALLVEQPFALALVDVLMPGESGLELIADMLAEHPDLAVVMVTGVDDPSIADLALGCGAFGYVVKPFTDNELSITAAAAGRRRCVEIQRKTYQRRLERQVVDQQADLDDALRQLKDAKDTTRPRDR